VYSIKRRMAYQRYKTFLDKVLANKDSPKEILEAAFCLVEDWGGHHRHFIARSAARACDFIAEERLLSTAVENNELPLLIKHKFIFDTNKKKFMKLLKEC